MNIISLFIYQATEVEGQTGLLSIVLRSGPLAKIVLAILLFFSVVSWAIIVDKYLALKRAKRDSRFFLRAFKNSKNFREIQNQCQKWKKSPFASMFLTGTG